MKRYKPEQPEVEDNSFSLSTGDLMAGLLFIFILLLMSALLRVQDMEDQHKAVVKAYDETKTHLAIDLKEEFKRDLKTWEATIDTATMSIRFQEPKMLFDEGKSDLKQQFKEILDDFFPRYIAVLKKKEYKPNIEEIRIEGHTNTNGGYTYNMKLSQDRTRAVLEYCLGMEQIKDDADWLRGLITANGLSYSKLIIIDGKEDQAKSRRVEFRIRTNAEEKLEEIAKSK